MKATMAKPAGRTVPGVAHDARIIQRHDDNHHMAGGQHTLDAAIGARCLGNQRKPGAKEVVADAGTPSKAETMRLCFDTSDRRGECPSSWCEGMRVRPMRPRP